MESVYVVGSDNGRRFIADRVYAKSDLASARTYCDQRQNDEQPWSVFKAPLGGDWLEWTHVWPESPARKVDR